MERFTQGIRSFDLNSIRQIRWQLIVVSKFGLKQPYGDFRNNTVRHKITTAVNKVSRRGTYVYLDFRNGRRIAGTHLQ